MSTPILMTKVKNAVKKQFDGDVEFKLRNTIINGDKRGCYGFIKNPENGVVVYLDTEKSVLSSLGYLVRYAKDFKDFTGTRNRMNHWSLDDIVEEVVKMLSNEAEWKQELASFKK